MNKLYYWFNDVNKLSSKYIKDLTTKLTELQIRNEEATCIYIKQKEDIFKNVAQTLEQKISDKFKKYRLKNLKKIQLLVQLKVI